MTTVSTLIPAYNAGAYIRQSVLSVLAQREVSVEVIVIDDGSTDETGKILEEFGSAVKVIRQANAGHVKARNRGAGEASGDWIAFLDADDEWLPHKLAKQLAAADGAGMVYTNRYNFGDCSRVKDLQSDFVHLWEGNVFEQLLLGNFITVSSAMMRADWFRRLGGFEESLLVCEDWDLWLRYCAAGGIIKVCREPLMRYRWHAGSMTNNQVRMCQGRLRVLERALALPASNRLPRSVVRRAFANVWLFSAWHAAAKWPLDALKWYVRSLLNWPWNLRVYKQMIKCCLRIS